MMARIEVSAGFDLALIAELAGNGDFEGRHYSDGYLYVSGVNQQDLDAALDAYNHDEIELSAARERFKAERAIAVSRIQVTTSSGKVFDGDETSQTRMVKAIVSLDAQTEVTHATWVLADNTVAEVDSAELKEALALSGLAQTALWMMPS